MLQTYWTAKKKDCGTIIRILHPIRIGVNYQFLRELIITIMCWLPPQDYVMNLAEAVGKGMRKDPSVPDTQAIGE